VGHEILSFQATNAAEAGGRSTLSLPCAPSGNRWSERLAQTAARSGESHPIGEPGVLEGLAREAGLTPQRGDEVEVPYEFPNRATLEQALLVIAPVYGIDPITARRVVHETVETAAERFRRADGSYRFENRFRYLIAAVS
jgi:hypothetical protein